MIIIHKNAYCKSDTKWCWHIRRDLLLQLYYWSILVGVRPILFLERVHINICNYWVEYKFGVHVILK